MRNIDDQMEIIRKRSETELKKKKERQMFAIELGMIAACFVLIFVAGMILPNLSVQANVSNSGIYGSLLTDSSSIGYVIIGILGFLLGICVTLLCIRLHVNEKEKGGDSQ